MSAEIGMRPGEFVREEILAAFGVDMDMLLRMQAWHDAHTMRQRADEIDVRRYDPPRTEPA